MFPDRLDISYTPYNLVFKEPGGTSRGVLYRKPTFFLRIQDSNDFSRTVYGEVPVFPGLSQESLQQVNNILGELTFLHSIGEVREFCNTLGNVSSIYFGIEQALASFSNPTETGLIFPSSFTRNQSSVTINGLIWMGNFEKMKERVRDKILKGFRCIKLKIGAINWDEEIRLIQFIRDIGEAECNIRVDANGAFSPDDCLWRLEQLADLGVESIEQPLKKGQWEAMSKLCAESPIPIALDEELIGIPVGEQRKALLDYIRPHSVVLKPALCFGFSGAADWIERAEAEGIEWWITSALESSVGLNAIAQFTGTYKPSIPQGLGTGNLFTNNFPSPLQLIGDEMSFAGPTDIYYPSLKDLDWIENERSDLSSQFLS